MNKTIENLLIISVIIIYASLLVSFTQPQVSSFASPYTTPQRKSNHPIRMIVSEKLIDFSYNVDERFHVGFRILNFYIKIEANQTRVILAQGSRAGKLVIGGTYTLKAGEELNGDLLILGSLATLEDESQVQGDVGVLGGTIIINGNIKGDLLVIGGTAYLGDSAIVKGDALAIGGKIDLSSVAKVEGETFSAENLEEMPFLFSFPDGRVDKDFPLPDFRMQVNPLVELLWIILRSFIWAFAALLVSLIAPNFVERTAKTAAREPLISSGMGLLTALVSPILIILLAITIIGIPLSFTIILVLFAGWAFGVISVGYKVGEGVANLINKEWPGTVLAGIGAFLLALVINGINVLVPCIGWIAPAVVGLLAIGAVVLTRFGTKEYPGVSESILMTPDNSDSINNE